MLAVFTLIANLSRNNGFVGLFDSLYYYLAGVGIRRTSRFAAASAFLIDLLSIVAAIKINHAGGVASIFFLALLLSNIRATWLAKSFAMNNDQAYDTPAVQSPGSIFTDVLPKLIWPGERWLYYGLTLLMLVGIAVLLLRTSTSPAEARVAHGFRPSQVSVLVKSQIALPSICLKRIRD